MSRSATKPGKGWAGCILETFVAAWANVKDVVMICCVVLLLLFFSL